jgi:hypothetical protein
MNLAKFYIVINFSISMLIELIAFLGLIAGFILAFFTQEEIKPGKKYFIWLKKAILFLLSGHPVQVKVPCYIWWAL